MDVALSLAGIFLGHLSHTLTRPWKVIQIKSAGLLTDTLFHILEDVDLEHNTLFGPVFRARVQRQEEDVTSATPNPLISYVGLQNWYRLS